MSEHFAQTKSSSMLMCTYICCIFFLYLSLYLVQHLVRLFVPEIGPSVDHQHFTMLRIIRQNRLLELYQRFDSERRTSVLSWTPATVTFTVQTRLKLHLQISQLFFHQGKYQVQPKYKKQQLVVLGGTTFSLLF